MEDLINELKNKNVIFEKGLSDQEFFLDRGRV